MRNSPGATVLYDKDDHKCIVYHSLVEGHGIQSNQFLLLDKDHAALIDPGGDLTFTPLTIEVSKHIDISGLDYIFASHQDPDIIASLPRWLVHCQCKVVTSRLWQRFLPHLASKFISQKLSNDVQDRIVPVGDKGECFDFGRSYISAVPAHFLHSVGNFQFYDPVSKILFSGDMGASVIDHFDHGFVEDFDEHIPLMEGFHKRYMCSNKAMRLWANMVRDMDVDMIVPQHGKAFRGDKMISKFLNWVSCLNCGVDLLSQGSYVAPTPSRDY